MSQKTEIKIQGQLNKNWQDYYENIDVIFDGENTNLLIEIKDDAFIHGVLNLIRDLNLKLISVNPLNQTANG